MQGGGGISMGLYSIKKTITLNITPVVANTSQLKELIKVRVGNK